VRITEKLQEEQRLEKNIRQQLQNQIFENLFAVSIGT